MTEKKNAKSNRDACLPQLWKCVYCSQVFLGQPPEDHRTQCFVVNNVLRSSGGAREGEKPTKLDRIKTEIATAV